jgi:hypothetical protein
MDGKWAFAVPCLRRRREYGKNGMMQELNHKSKMYSMISSLRQNFDCSKIYFFRFLAIRWWVKWRFTSRSYYDTASRIDEIGIASSRSNGHVALPYFQVQVGHTIMEQHKIVKKCLNTLKAILLYTCKVGTHY